MTMKNPKTCLSAELLRQLTADELSPVELAEVEEHISDCERCRQLLDVPQSDSQWRDEIVSALRAPSESLHVASDHDGGSGKDESLDSILRLLGPTDDPHMLGRIGSYEVVGMIGRGGMGVVFKAFETSLNRFVAIKMLLPHLAASGAARKRFAREGQAAAAVIDDNVMPIYSVAEWQGVPYLVTQYSRGSTLDKRIRDEGPLELKEILRIGMQTARGLAAAHAQGLVHRDVKPSNILLDGTVDRALLTDFGLARAVDDASITRTGVIAGTPQFMSPEQASGDPVDARSDLFSLGSVLYTMCTGRPPFRAETSLGILRRIADDEPRRIREVNPSVPVWLCGLIGKLMAKKPSDRYRSAADVARLFEQCLAHVQQPGFNPLPNEAHQLQVSCSKLFPNHPRFRKAVLIMTKVLVPVVVCVALIATRLLLSPPAGKAVTALQGEWMLVAAEHEGTAMPQEQLFEERLVIDGNRFSRHQTAPSGNPIDAEKGSLSFNLDGPTGAIDFVVRAGTIHGLYKIEADELTLCVTREGGPRPESFQTKAGDSKMLQKFRRTKKAANEQTTTENDPGKAWTDSWLKRIPNELSGPRDNAQKWMRDQGFKDIVSEEITLEVMKRIHPKSDQQSIERAGVRSYLYGVLQANPTQDTRNAIEVYCWFDATEKMLGLKVEPHCPDSPEADQQGPRFTEPLRLELKRGEAHSGRWFFVDLEGGKLAIPPFEVELDREKLPWSVIRPDEVVLKEWLIESGVDLVLFVEPQPIAGKSGQWSERTSSWSIRTSRSRANGLLLVPHVDGQAWHWNDRPDLVLTPFARKNEAVHVSGFVPSASGNSDIRPDNPDVQAFRTAHNVVGFYLLEHNDPTNDSLDLTIVHVANCTAPLADQNFDGLHVSGKLGVADPPGVTQSIVED